MPFPSRPFDLAVVGAGIVGLSCALAAARLGKRVVVIDRDAQANGASVRNFGFVTVTGQARGEVWRRARRSREVWDEVAPKAGVAIDHRGLWMTARRPEAVAVLDAFLDTEMGEGCALLSPRLARSRCEAVVAPDTRAVLWSPHDLRVDSREAIPRLADWLERDMGVVFVRETAALDVQPPRILTSRGVIEAEAAIVCAGDDLVSLFPERLEAHGLRRCKLQMLRLADPGFRLPGAVMSDLGLVRYSGYANLPQAQVLRARLQAEQGEHLKHGVHLIVVQGRDGQLVVGDSHHYAPTPDPFAVEAVDRLILDEYAAATGRPAPAVLERWTGTYAWAADRQMLIDRPSEAVRVVVVTSGTGASTGFAIGEEVVDELFSRTVR